MGRSFLVDRCDNCGVTLRPMTPERHRAAEAVYRDCAEQLDWPKGSGVKHSPWWWHQMMLAAFAEEKGWQPEFWPSLTGSGLVMTTRTKQSRLTNRQGAELVHFARATAIEKGAVLREPPEREEPPLEAYS